MKYVLFRSYVNATMAWAIALAALFFFGAPVSSISKLVGSSAFIALAAFELSFLFHFLGHLIECSHCRRRIGLDRLARKRRQAKGYRIGGQVYKPALHTRQLVEKINEAAYQPSHPLEMITGPTTEEARKEQLDSLFRQLRLLLVDEHGHPPDQEILEFHVPVVEAQLLLYKLGPDAQVNQVEEVHD